MRPLGLIFAKLLLTIPTYTKLPMAEHIVKSQVKESVDANVAADFYEELDEHVEELLERAEERAEANGRSTLQPRDL